MKEKNITKLTLLHIVIGGLIAFFPLLAKLYSVLIVLFGIYFIVKNRNRNNEALYVIAYVVGSEVFLRTTYGSFCYEFGKYFMLFFSLLGLYYTGFSTKRNPYFIYLLLIIPGILMTLDWVSLQEFKENTLSDSLGPICLGIFALYSYKRKISKEELNDILTLISLPVIACCMYLVVRFPYYDGVINNCESNFYLSGIVAPNQMATILGLGTFIIFLRLLLNPSSKMAFGLSLIVFCFVYYRGLLTFSRGGMFTCFGITAILLFAIFMSKEQYRLSKKRVVLLLVVFPAVFLFATVETNQLLYRRYVNENINGLPKTPEIHGRADMALEEIRFFEENPALGLGIGKTKEVREAKYGKKIMTHNELTRLLAEHGLFGVLSIIILIVCPLVLYLKNKKNIYLLPLFGFWLLTINHSGMRIAAPAFLYGLALFDIELKKRNEAVDGEAVSST